MMQEKSLALTIKQFQPTLYFQSCTFQQVLSILYLPTILYHHTHSVTAPPTPTPTLYHQRSTTLPAHLHLYHQRSTTPPAPPAPEPPPEPLPEPPPEPPQSGVTQALYPYSHSPGFPCSRISLRSWPATCF